MVELMKKLPKKRNASDAVFESMGAIFKSASHLTTLGMWVSDFSTEH
ncbi:MAG: hypothetical protein OXC66_02205 [Roseovarius sp.]|nr:hypothetical protein [Roseovarius sp.]